MKKLIVRTFAAWMVFSLVLSILQPVGAAVGPEAKKININTASSADLQQLPRIGPKVAQRIIDFREKHGKFKRVEDLMKVKGIGEKTFMNLRDLITVGTEKK